jgi:hypothetical protein
LGFDAREVTPTLVHRIIFAAADTRSFRRAEIVLQEVGGHVVDAKSVERLVQDVGGELAQRRDADLRRGHPLARAPAEPPDLAVVECDGGRIRTREPGQGPGVHLETEGWRETKNACLIRAQRQTFVEDPQSEPPECFSNPRHVAKIAETQALSVASPLIAAPARKPVEDEEEKPPVSDWRPKRVVRTVLSSMANAKEFGRQMSREAKRRRFPEASAKAFLGDGLPWNWSIWQKHFRDFTPILDFIHPLSYLFVVAKSLHADAQNAWSQYLVWMRGCWQGEVRQVLDELRQWQTRIGTPPDEAPENDPCRLLAKTITYLENNERRMQYPAYRQQGFPVTTAWMESLVKEVNYRVKGTEMFWNNPEGAEAILQVRAAALCDDGRLADHLQTRPGCSFTRRPKPPKSSPQKIKS